MRSFKIALTKPGRPLITSFSRDRDDSPEFVVVGGEDAICVMFYTNKESDRQRIIRSNNVKIIDEIPPRLEIEIIDDANPFFGTEVTEIEFCDLYGWKIVAVNVSGLLVTVALVRIEALQYAISKVTKAA